MIAFSNDGRDPQSRKIKSIPPKGERMRVIIDSDAKNEIDDSHLCCLMQVLTLSVQWRKRNVLLNLMES